MGKRTFTIIKPDSVGGNHIGPIVSMIEESGFRVIALKMTCLSRSDAEKFYHVHKGKPFFRNLQLFMTSGPIVAAVLEKDNSADAVAEFRELIGKTNPDLAAEGTIRKRFAASKTRNAIHASDSDANAAWETSFFFRDKEIIDTEYELPLPEEQIDND